MHTDQEPATRCKVTESGWFFMVPFTDFVCDQALDVVTVTGKMSYYPGNTGQVVDALRIA